MAKGRGAVNQQGAVQQPPINGILGQLSQLFGGQQGQSQGQQGQLQGLMGLFNMAQQLGGQQQDFRGLTRDALQDARTNRQPLIGRQPFEVPRAQRPKVKDVFAERDRTETTLQDRIAQLEQQLAERRQMEDRIGAGR